jgi:mannosyltransferase
MSEVVIVTRAGARDWQVRTLVLAVLVVSLGLRAWGLNAQSIWRDEADSLHFASSPALLGEMFTTPGHNAPLYYLALRGWQALAGGDIIAARIFSALWGAGSVALMWGVGRRLLGERPALVAAVLAGTSPYLVWYSQEARTYSLLVMAVLLSFWLYLDALAHGGVGRWVLYLLCTGLSLYLHVTAVLIVPVQVFAGVLLRPRGKGGWRAWGIVTLLLLAPAIPLLIWEMRLLLAPFQTGHALAPAGDVAGGMLLAFTAGPSGRFGLWWALPALFLALIGMASPWLQAKSQDMIPRTASVWILTAWLLFPPLGLWGISLAMPVFSERYLIFVAPAFYMLIALGVGILWDRWKGVAIAGCAAVLIVHAAGLTVDATQTIKPDIRSAAQHYAAARQSDDLVLFLIPQNQGAFEQVTPANGQTYAGAPYANRSQSLSAVGENLSELLAGRARVWLVESEPALWDARGLTRQWLTTHSRRATTTTFHLVTLTLFEEIRTQPTE